MISVLIASDHSAYRAHFARLVMDNPLFQLLAVCADTFAATSIATSQDPDITIIDGSSDPLAAIAATRRILSASRTTVIAVTSETDGDFAEHMLAAGALGYLTKKSSAAECITALQEVLKDNVYVCNALREERQLPSIPTPQPFTTLVQKSDARPASLGAQLRHTLDAMHVNHWHKILSFTN